VQYIIYIVLFMSLNLLSGYLFRLQLTLHLAVPLAYLFSLPPFWFIVTKKIVKHKTTTWQLVLHSLVTILELILILIATLALNFYLTDYALGQANFQISTIKIIKTLSHAVALIITGSFCYPLYMKINKIKQSARSTIKNRAYALRPQIVEKIQAV